MRAERAAWKAMEEQRIAAEMAAVEVKQVAEEKAVVEARWVEEEWRVAELEERWKAMAVAKARAEEAAVHRIMEEKVAVEAAARCKAVLAMAETAAEGAETEQVVRLLAKQKGWVEGEWLVCNCCVMWGFNCQVRKKNWFFF